MKKTNMHFFNLPEKIWSGRESAMMLSNRIISNGISRPFIIIDPNVRKTKFGKKVLNSLIHLNKKIFIWDEISTNAPSNQVVKASEAIKLSNANGIIVIGGGSSIDLAKTANLLSLSGKPLEWFWSGNAFNDSLLPIFAVPTTCGTGSEVTPFAVVLDTNTRIKRGLSNDTFIPKEVFLDCDSLASLPSKLIAATGIDAMCHALESYISNGATPLTQCGVIGAIVNIYKNIQMAFKTKNPQALESLLVSSTSARLLYPRTGLTITHAMSHPLGAYFNIHHGEAVARLIPITFKFNIDFFPSRFAEIARIIGVSNKSTNDTDAANLLVTWFENLIQESKINKEQLVVSLERKKIIEEMAKTTMQSSNIPTNPREVNTKDIISLFEKIL